MTTDARAARSICGNGNGNGNGDGDGQEVKPYSRIAAISEAFKIVNSNVLEAEQRKQLQAIRADLDRLEDGGSQVIDV